MRNYHLRTVVAGLGSFLLLLSGTASAAKGVKKNGATDLMRTYAGRLINVTYGQNGSGSISLRTAGKSNKQGSAQQAAGAGVRSFAANTMTSLTTSTGSPASPTALQRGTRVRVRATGNQATSIQLLTTNRSRGAFMRHSAMAYRPHGHHRASYRTHSAHHSRRR